MRAPFEAFLLPVAEPIPGHRFCIYHPAHGDAAKGAVVYVHPFAEEMNKSRRMAAMQSRALAQAGYAVLQIDLLGCGDSSGDFGDASWQDWVDDVLRACAWLQQRVPAPLWLWGLRAGCLIAADAARRMAQPPHFLFWAPTVSGRQVLQQFLRLKAASDLAGGGAKTILDGLRNDLAQGRAVEIAGYTLSPGLASGMERSSLEPVTAPASTPPAADMGQLEWIELNTRADATMTPVGAKTLESWTQAGWHAARGHVVQGPAFWQTTEIEDAPALLGFMGSGLAFCPLGESNKMGSGLAFCPARGQKARPDPIASISFDCEGETLLGVLALPCANRPESDIGVVVIVGGPQYRVGSHRQFLQLSRHLADAGVPVLRFDVRGMGDSTGELHTFEHVDQDIAAAIDALQRAAPQVKRVVLWGLCDGASAALLYCHATRDARVRGLCLLNPWVRSQASLARAHVKHYYADRLKQKEFWIKLASGKVAGAAVRGLWRNLRDMRAGPGEGGGAQELPFQQRMAIAWKRFEGPIMLGLSGNDYTAKEFAEYTSAEPAWDGLLDLRQVLRCDMPGVDHTFSTTGSGAKVARITSDWMGRLQ